MATARVYPDVGEDGSDRCLGFSNQYREENCAFSLRTVEIHRPDATRRRRFWQFDGTSHSLRARAGKETVKDFGGVSFHVVKRPAKVDGPL